MAQQLDISMTAIRPVLTPRGSVTFLPRATTVDVSSNRSRTREITDREYTQSTVETTRQHGPTAAALRLHRCKVTRSMRVLTDY